MRSEGVPCVMTGSESDAFQAHTTCMETALTWCTYWPLCHNRYLPARTAARCLLHALGLRTKGSWSAAVAATAAAPAAADSTAPRGSRPSTASATAPTTARGKGAPVMDAAAAAAAA